MPHRSAASPDFRDFCIKEVFCIYKWKVKPDWVNAHLKDIDVAYEESVITDKFELINKKTKEKELMVEHTHSCNPVPNKELSDGCSIPVEHVTKIFGTPITNLSTEKLYNAIKKLQNMIDSLEEVKEEYQPKALKAKVAGYVKAIKEIVKLVDARESK